MAGMEARIQTGALPTVGCSVFVRFTPRPPQTKRKVGSNRHTTHVSLVVSSKNQSASGEAASPLAHDGPVQQPIGSGLSPKPIFWVRFLICG